MKRKIRIISTLLVIVIVIISTILLTNKDDNKYINLDNGIAYYYEQEDGNYVPGSSNGWSGGSYALNVGKSICNNINNPSDTLDWDIVNKTVLMSSNENINCTLYFDKAYTAEEFFAKFTQAGSEGELLHHTKELENGAEDNSYRYSGNNPNNFICFGPGSEDYNKGVTSATCPDGNLYRMIGYVPVELPNGTKENRIKVIKSEYATHDDLGKEKADGRADSDDEYINLKRVNIAQGADAFYWKNDRENGKNTWSSSELYTGLNDKQQSFVHNLGVEWQNQIEDVQWNVGGNDKDELPKAKVVYDEEWDIKYGAQTKVQAKIGLMYPSDYGFASSKENWVSKLYNYNTDENRKNNWLFNGIGEWTISSVIDDNHKYSFNVDCIGYIDYDNWVYESFSVRPVFYLKSDVKLVNDNNIDGSMDHPFRLA